MSAPVPTSSLPATGVARAAARKAPRGLLPRAVVERLVLGSFLAASLAVIWWSVGRLLELQAHSRVLNQEVAKLSGEIDVMRVKWTGDRTEEVGERFAAVGGSLFNGDDAVADWAEALRREAIPLGLETNLRVNSTQVVTNGATSFTRVLATLEAQPNSSVRSPRPVYHRLVDWTRRLALEPRRVDLLEFSITGTSIEASTALATVEFWAQEVAAPAEAPSIAATASPDSRP